MSAKADGQRRDQLLTQLDDVADRIGAADLTIGELRRFIALFSEVDDRLAGRKRKPARVLHLVRRDSGLESVELG